MCVFSPSLSLVREIGVTYLVQQPQELCYPFPLMCLVFLCVWILKWAQMLMCAMTRKGCTDTVRESAPEVDSGRKIPCSSRDSNLRQYCAWLLSRTLNLLSHPHPMLCRCLPICYCSLILTVE